MIYMAIDNVHCAAVDICISLYFSRKKIDYNFDLSGFRTRVICIQRLGANHYATEAVLLLDFMRIYLQFCKICVLMISTCWCLSELSHE